MNSVFLVGRVTKDIELRYTSSEMATVKFSVAVDRAKKGESDFINCVAFGKTAELLDKYVGKGGRVGISGSIRTGSYEKNGTRVYTTDVVVNNLDILDFKDSGKGYKEEKKESPKDEFIEYDGQEDLPF